MAKIPHLNKQQAALLVAARPDLGQNPNKIDYKAVQRWYEKFGYKDEAVNAIVSGSQPAPPPSPPAPSVPAATVQAAPMEIPPNLASDPNFQALPDDLKQIAVYSYNIQKQNDETKAKALSAAYEEAVKQADPYWKNIIRIAQDELLNSFDAQKGDYTSIQERLNRRISELNTDLQTGTEFLNLEQQQELANLTLAYTKNRDSLIETSAQQGLTFSTKRKLAEQQLGEYQTGMVESTKRQYQKQIADLTREVSSGNIAAQKDLEEAKRKYNEQLLSTGRTAEKYLGTENLPTMEGYTPLGEVPGQLYEDKVTDTAQRQQALYNEATQSSLNF